MKNIELLYDVLKKVPKFVDKEGCLLKNTIQESALKMDADLLKVLISNPETENMFFIDIDDVLVFDKDKFNWLIDSKDFLPDSYTGYKNKIMLTDEKGNSIENNNDVVLSFPCKDCLLEMDSTKETDDRQEVFFNEVLMRSEIDTLLAPKVMANPQKYDSDGIHETTSISDKDNLIINGNNLLSMYSLLPRYKGQIKLMYWDILYNTKSDKVPYADRFKHSSWLVMMKNRLEIAKQLLRDDGIICLQCDDNEMAYLTVLCGEIFGRENRINTLVIEMASTGGVKRSSKDKHFLKTKEYILVYAKLSVLSINCIYNPLEQLDPHFNIFFNGEEFLPLFAKICDVFDAKYSCSWNDFLINKEIKKFIIDNRENIYQTDGHGVSTWVFNKDASCKLIYNKNEHKVYKAELNGKVEIFKESNGKTNNYTKMQPLAWKIKNINGELEVCNLRGDIWKEFSKDMGNVTKEGSVKLSNGKKPERLIYDIISAFSNDGDIVLDAYLGSGTTAAVAHKMGRQYIGIEQLDKHAEMSIKRLQSVIKGDLSGISKAVEWKGGGSFIYCELAKNSQNMIDKINSASEPELSDIYDEIKSSDFVSYKVDIKAMEKEKNGFEKLSVLEKKKFLTYIIDKNTIYINYSDMNDEDYSIDLEIKEFNKNFYKESK